MGRKSKFLKKTMQLCIDFVYDFAEMVLVVGEVVMVSLNYKDFPKGIGFYPGLISLIQSFEVVNSY
jgi:hypothetical protein